MAGYLEDYGVEDARRGKLVKRVVVAALVLVVVGLTAYFTLRTYSGKRQIRAFLQELRSANYPAAYKLWGCTQDSPCKDYTFDKFMEDWGPKSQHPEAGSAELSKTRYCGTGVILTLKMPKGDELPLWYERGNGTLGFSPWPVCLPTPKGFQ
jgi:hypothetical protein